MLLARVGRTTTVTQAAPFGSGKDPSVRAVLGAAGDGGASFWAFISEQAPKLFERCGLGAYDDASVGLAQVDLSPLDDELS